MLLQVMPSISPYDAISQHVIRLKKELDANNIENLIIADYVAPTLSDLAQRPQTLDSFDDCHILYHMSISSSLAEKVCASNSHLDVWYHNITPAEFIQDWEPYVALELRIARQQLSYVAVRADRGVAASRYSENELKAQGCRKTSIMPVLFDVSSKINAVPKDGRSKGASLLSVGRFAPHKRVELLIQALYLYRLLCDSEATLTLVGSNASQYYRESLELLIENLSLSEYVFFKESISDEQLADEYAKADLYLCLSEHEGFCVPLLEAQYAGLPIVACDYAAIKETVGNSGVILDANKDLHEVVAAIDLVLHDVDINKEIVLGAKENILRLNIDEEARRAVRWLVEEKT